MKWQKLEEFGRNYSEEFKSTKLNFQSMEKGVAFYKKDNIKCWASNDYVGDYDFDKEEILVNLVYCESCKIMVDGEIVFET